MPPRSPPRPAQAVAGPELNGLRIFISYPRGGAAHTWAEKVHADLDARGATVWRDEHGVEEGDDDWYARIRDALERADVVACIVGANSDGSKWQQREMLKADKLALPVVAFRTAAVDLPLLMNEKQPVELQDPQVPAPSFDTLATALAQAASRRTVSNGAQPAARQDDAAQRRRETDYLRDLLHGDLSTHEARYEPVAGLQRQSPSLARSHKGLRIDTHFALRAFNQADTIAPPQAAKAFTDVLDAYRQLPGWRIRRLAVLGEPGAGKSFSLERIACDYARRALNDVAAPIPLLVKLGLWTREAEPLAAFIEKQLGDLGRDFEALRDQRRAVLLLDGMNEIPPQQRLPKAEQLRRLAEDERFAAVVVSCREREFNADYALPFDTLTLQPLSPLQIHRFLHRAYTLNEGLDLGPAQAETRFWQIAGGDALRAVWQGWQAAGASFEQFWSLDDVPRENPNFLNVAIGKQYWCWREARNDARSLVRLAANPYLLSVMTVLPAIPHNRAQLFDGFLRVLYDRERQGRDARHNGRSVPTVDEWHAALIDLAEALQSLQPAGDETQTAGAATTLPRSRWPASMTTPMLAFSIDASVLQRVGNDLRFTHQLLQEALASRVLLEASRSGTRKAFSFWPADCWWQRNGWEVVAEIATEACAGDDAALWRLMAWLAEAQPEVASDAWRRAGAPALPAKLAADVTRRWLPRLTNDEAEPSPMARAAIGRALAGFDLDHRPGTGLRADGLPDIDLVRIPGDRPFIYQDDEQLTLPTFEIARFPITNRQFQAFVDAGGYADDRWWKGLADRFEQPEEPSWNDTNAPRETVSWCEAVAFCRWLGDALACDIQLPTEQQWERATSGNNGNEYPWSSGYGAGCANCDEPTSEIENGTDVGRTTAVGIYPAGSAEGVHDLAGNVWEWCLNEYGKPERINTRGKASRVLRGGAWNQDAGGLRAAGRSGLDPGHRDLDIGFRVCRASPIEKPSTGARNTGSRKR